MDKCPWSGPNGQHPHTTQQARALTQQHQAMGKLSGGLSSVRHVHVHYAGPEVCGTSGAAAAARGGGLHAHDHGHNHGHDHGHDHA